MTTLTPATVPAGLTEAPPAARRWFANGRSAEADARTAGAQAASAALAGRTASLVIVFCPVSMDLAAMLDGVRSEAGDVPLIGCTGNPLFAGAATAEPSVAVSALGGDGFEVAVSVARNVSAGQRAAGIHVAEHVATLTREHQVLMMLCDGLAGDGHEVVRGAYSVVGASVPLVGGCAADDLAMVETFQFYSDDDGVHIVSDALVAAAIGSDAPIGVGVAHGWHRVGEPMLVTDSADGLVRTIDGEPALDVFLDRTNAPPSILNDNKAFQTFCLQHPFGISRRDNEDLRCVADGNPENGSLTCLVDVPQGALIWLMEPRDDSLIACVDDAFDAALAPLGDARPLGFLAFDCIARHAVIGADGITGELDRLVDRATGAPLTGFVTYGEVARIRGSRGMHQLTLVLVAFA